MNAYSIQSLKFSTQEMPRGGVEAIFSIEGRRDPVIYTQRDQWPDQILCKGLDLRARIQSVQSTHFTLPCLFVGSIRY